MDLRREIDKLYDLEPEGFVVARDALAKRLREDGQNEEASEVRALRRPTVAAWALNRLARDKPGDVAGLFEVGRDLRVAQRGALSGLRGGALREAARRRRVVVDRLVVAAEEILEASGRSGSHRDAITRTLETALGDDDAAEALRTGRLEKELDRPPGFGDLTGLVPVPQALDDGDEGGPSKAGSKTKAKAAPKEDPRLRRLRSQRDAAADDARRASREAVGAGERAVQADREAEAAARAIEGLERDLRAARRREREAVEASRTATAAVKKSEAAAERARARVEDLQARLEKLIRG